MASLSIIGYILPNAEELTGRLGSEIILAYVSELTQDPYENLHQSYLQKIVEVTKDGASRSSNKPGIGPTIEVKIEADKALVTAYLNQVGARLKEKGISVLAEERLGIEIRFGNAAEEIMQIADEKHVDIVAMTTHGRSGVGRRVFGSVAERILREGNTPLLLVRSPGARGEQ